MLTALKCIQEIRLFNLSKVTLICRVYMITTVHHDKYFEKQDGNNNIFMVRVHINNLYLNTNNHKVKRSLAEMSN